MTMTPSLFDAPSAPVLPTAAGWLTGTLFGQVAVILRVFAVALMGLLLMTGRLSVRDAARVVLACFVLLGAPLIAAGLRSAADDAGGAPAIEAAAVVPGGLPTAD
jgi:type IV secretory pathway VirB2 component (pilin)